MNLAANKTKLQSNFENSIQSDDIVKQYDNKVANDNNMRERVTQDREDIKVTDDCSRVAQADGCKLTNSDCRMAKANSRITDHKRIVKETNLGVREANIGVRDELVKRDDKVLNVNKDRRSITDDQKLTKDDQQTELEDEEDCCKCLIL